MQLKEAKVENFRCIDDSGWVSVEDITCLIGKNESGKTAFLEALNILNPVNESEEYDQLEHYPRNRLSEYERTDGIDTVASARYELPEEELESINSEIPHGTLESLEIQVSKDYNNELHWTIPLDEAAWVESTVQQYDLPSQTNRSLREADTINELKTKVGESESDSEALERLARNLEGIDRENVENRIGNNYILSTLPKFLYFDEYYEIPGKIHLPSLDQRNPSNYSNAERTFLGLVDIAGFDISEIRSANDNERIIMRLEAASNDITEDVFEYWSQGPDLTVNLRTDPAQGDSDISEDNGKVLQIRVENLRHGVTIPFDDRSSGFKWFFSFLAYFSQFENDGRDLVLLLDEPGLNLHAKAQSDFLRFIKESLAPSNQVIYTTHSPFMVDPKNLHRTRIVNDVEEEGTKVTSDILESDDDTVFPLQAVLGIDLIQTVVLGPRCLLVEGPSDLVYLQTMSDILEQAGKTGIHHSYTIVPVGSGDKIPTFVSMFGASDLDLSVLLDSESSTYNRLEDIESRGVLDMDKVLKIDEFTGQETADIEDLFSVDEYLRLVNESCNHHLEEDIVEDNLENQHPRIAFRLDSYFESRNLNDGRFNHHTPAAHLQRNQEDWGEILSDGTLERFEHLFDTMNSLFGLYDEE